MGDHPLESGLELVLDIRKLIIAFLVLISVCGFFFVLGFVEGKREGKRQGFGEGTQSAAAIVPGTNSGEIRTKESAAAAAPDAGSLEKTANPVDPPLDWYKNVNQEQVKEESKIEASPKSEAEEPTGKSKSHVLPATAITYSVQVGAFSKEHEAEAKARSLKSKGFDYRIESPHAPEQFYLLKVGKFSSRAEAIAMQRRLTKSGFACFVKTN
jgi:cell division protein FtsN